MSPSGRISATPAGAHVLEGLRRRDPITGLTDAAQPLAIQRMIIQTPSLAARLLRYFAGSEAALREALEEGDRAPDVEDRVTARVLAASVTSVLRALAEHNATRLTEGESADTVAPEATAAVERAFALLGHGFGHGLGR
jgi:hypothetical protein